MSFFIIVVVAFIVAISVLVGVHEFGHFWVARRLGIKVLRFSIGFGKPLWRRIGAKDQTEFVISALPLGGYVKMLDERDCTVAPEDKHRTFNSAPLASRLAILAAGPLFNFLFAIGIYWIVFMVGGPEVRPVIGKIMPGSYAAAADLRPGDEIVSVGDQTTRTWEQAVLAIIDDLIDDGRIDFTVRGESGTLRDARVDVGGEKRRLTEPGALFDGLGIGRRPSVPARIARVVPGEAAASGGVQKDDLILSFDEQPIADWEELYEYVSAQPGKEVTVRVRRGAQELDLPLTIGEKRDKGQTVGFIGVEGADPMAPRRETVRYGPIEAMGKAVTYTGELTLFTVRMLWHMVTGNFSVRNISGPITIAEFAGTSAQMGPQFFIRFLAIVSLSLGILNLMPVPLLDGGQMVFQVAGAIKGSPLSPETELRGQQVGIVLILMLMSLAFYNDILRLVGRLTG